MKGKKQIKIETKEYYNANTCEIAIELTSEYLTVEGLLLKPNRRYVVTPELFAEISQFAEAKTPEEKIDETT